jgi:hypothetical protein
MNRKEATKLKRAAWMCEFEMRVLELAPQFAGRIEWDSAIYFYNMSFHPYEAAKRYVATREQAS